MVVVVMMVWLRLTLQAKGAAGWGRVSGSRVCYCVGVEGCAASFL